MTDKISIDDVEYEVSDFSVSAKKTLEAIKFVSEKTLELKNMRIVLQRAKNSYVDGLKKEMLSKKAGILLGDD